MHVRITREEQKRGIFGTRPVFAVTTTITYSEEEKVLLKERGLRDFVIWEGTYNGQPSRMVAHWFLPSKLTGKISSWGKKFDSLIEAEAYERHVRDSLLSLKKALDMSAEEPNKSDSFEL